MSALYLLENNSTWIGDMDVAMGWNEPTVSRSILVIAHDFENLMVLKIF